MPTDRTTRVSEVIRRELTALIPRAVELDGHLITVNEVRVTPDLKQAFVYLSLLNSNEPETEVLHLMNKYRHDWQRDIGHRIQTKFTPRLVFKFDDTIERGDRINELLNEIEKTPTLRPPTSPS